MKKESRQMFDMRSTLLLDEDNPGRPRVRGAEREIDEQAALGVGMKENAEEFVASGGEIYQTH